MTADEARSLAAKAKQEQADISNWVEHLDKRIADQAKLGGTHIVAIFAGVRMPCSDEQQRLIREHYVKKGFTLTDSVISWNRP